MFDLTDNKNIAGFVKAAGHFNDTPENLEKFHDYVQLHAADYDAPSNQDEMLKIYEDIYEDYLTDGQ